MPQNVAKTLPAWIMPDDLAEILEDDGEWEDASWDPLLLTVVADTRHEGRLIKRAWQLTLWPGDAFFDSPNKALSAHGEKPDGLTWSELILSAIEVKAPALMPRLHDESSREACVIWAEAEADGRTLLELTWAYVHEALPA